MWAVFFFLKDFVFVFWWVFVGFVVRVGGGGVVVVVNGVVVFVSWREQPFRSVAGATMCSPPFFLVIHAMEAFLKQCYCWFLFDFAEVAGFSFPTIAGVGSAFVFCLSVGALPSCLRESQGAGVGSVIGRVLQTSFQLSVDHSCLESSPAIQQSSSCLPSSTSSIVSTQQYDKLLWPVCVHSPATFSNQP